MCKVVIINKQENEKIYEKKFTDVQKAMKLKEVVERYTNKDKIEVNIEHKGERKRK